MSYSSRVRYRFGSQLFHGTILLAALVGCGSNLEEPLNSATASLRRAAWCQTPQFPNGLNAFSLQKTRNNSIWLRRQQFRDAGPGDIEIRELLPEGQFGDDLSGKFAFVADGQDLRLNELGTVLKSRHWYAMINDGAWEGVCPFEKHFRAFVGDVDSNGFVTAIDIGQVNASPVGPVASYSRFDINGDGFRTAVDVAIAHAWHGIMPPKPSGHGD